MISAAPRSIQVSPFLSAASFSIQPSVHPSIHLKGTAVQFESARVSRNRLLSHHGHDILCMLASGLPRACFSPLPWTGLTLHRALGHDDDCMGLIIRFNRLYHMQWTMS